MRKIYLLIITAFISTAAYSQTEEGTWQFEVGTSAFGENTIKQGTSTGFNLFSTDGTTIFSIGAEGGYFFQDNTAIKFGLGYTDLDFTNFLTYKLGFKHYAGGNVPIQMDLTGATNEDQDTFGGGTIDTPDPLWLGFQIGYAAFFSDNVAFEPTIRYNASLNKDFTDEGILELKFNFVIFF
ncbi:hypothetical protein [Ekhidna sp.]|uniref:hypothetical protein n=1 Tax=Ekhidna sp. TaxID=2608089 RepID=UPI00329A4F47